MKKKIEKTEEEWENELTPDQYRVTRKKATEPPFTGAYNEFEEKGLFKCVCCGNELFSSEAKYKSGSGWPSFWAPISKEKVSVEEDGSLGMQRSEVLCSECDAHLGHVFPDGPEPTGMRFCINSISLDFDDSDKTE